MDIWHDMEVRVDKKSRMGVRSSISRNDFKKFCVIHDVIEEMNFSEIRIIRKGDLLIRDDTTVEEVLEKITDKELRSRVADMVGKMENEALRKVYLTLLSYSKKELLV
jgi:hypothetical protein